MRRNKDLKKCNKVNKSLKIGACPRPHDTTEKHRSEQAPMLIFVAVYSDALILRSASA